MPVLANAFVETCQLIFITHKFVCSSWLPLQPLRFCLSHTECKVVIVDAERADLLEPLVSSTTAGLGNTEFFVFDSHEGKGWWKGMECFRDAVERYRGDPIAIIEEDPQMMPEDDAVIMFTSGNLKAARYTPIALADRIPAPSRHNWAT